MPTHGLLKRASTISERFREDVSRTSSRSPADSNTESSETVAQDVQEKKTEVSEIEQVDNIQNVSDLVDEDDGASDTDVAPSDDELEKQIKKAQEQKGDEPPIRMSKRLMSLKRRGKAVEIVEEPEKFDYYAGDTLTVRGEDTDFYVCRVLEDVPENSEAFRIAWYDRVEENLFKVSYDDTIYDASVIAHVSLVERDDGMLELTQRSLKMTRRILKRALKKEKIGDKIVLTDVDEEEAEGDDEEDEDDEEAPPVKRRRKTSASKKEKSPRKPKAAQPKRERKEKPPKEPKVGKRRGLLRNPEIDVTEEDILFTAGSKIPIAPVRRGVQAVLSNDMKSLEAAIQDVENVYTIFWNRSPDISLGPIEYALLMENRAALELMKPDKLPKTRKAKRPQVTLTKMDTGTYNFCTFGHHVRAVEASRGSREGNNAFLKSESEADQAVDTQFCLRNGISHELIDEYGRRSTGFNADDGIIEDIWMAIKSGHRKLAAHYVGIAVKRDSHGFNFLHHEVLDFDDQPLSNFRIQSVTKKPYENKTIMPLHCACINPNPKYAQALFNAHQEYNTPDAEMWKPIHFAAVCEGAGPLSFLLSRGVDPNDVTKQSQTPLMLAAEHGRDECVKALMELTFTEESDEEGGPAEKKKRVNINAKSKATLAPIHYAAKAGHESTVRLLVKEGAKIDLQTGAGSNNFTALAFAAQEGHFKVVKALCELGASPDKRLRQSKTALMHAAINGHYHVMSYLLNFGVDPNAADSSLNTPIHYAAAYGWYHCLQLLLEAGGNPNCANNWKTTPLSVAMMKDHLSCADLLLSLDVDVDFKDDNGKTILMFELLSNYDEKMLERVDYLVKKKGASPNIQDSNGFSSLHYLASHSIYRRISRGTLIADLNKTDDQSGEENESEEEEDEEEEEEQEDEEEEENYDNDDNQDEDWKMSQEDEEDDEKEYMSDGSKDDDSGTAGDSPTRRSGRKRMPVKRYTEDNKDKRTVRDGPTFDKKKSETCCKAAKILLDAGADPNLVDENGQTPLIVAILQNNFPLIEILIEHGAQPSVGKVKSTLNTPLHLLVEKVDKLDLFDYFEGEYKDPESYTADEISNVYVKQLKRAVLKFAKLQIQNGADVDAINKDGETALMIALGERDAAVIDLLLKSNANPMIGKDTYGFNVLHHMCYNHPLDNMVGFLNTINDKYNLKDSPLKEQVNNDGYTPFLLACERYSSTTKETADISMKFMKALIEKVKVDVYAQVQTFNTDKDAKRNSKGGYGLTSDQDPDGKYKNYHLTGLFTCLHFMIFAYTNEKGDCAALKKMLEYTKGKQGFINTLDRHGRTPLHFAVRASKELQIKMLVNYGPDLNLLSGNKVQDELGTAVFICASRYHLLKTAKFLIDAGADPNIPNAEAERTPLMKAILSHKDDTAKLDYVTMLVNAGANVNLKDSTGKTALHLAAGSTSGGYETLTEVEDFLVSHNADVTAKDIYNRVPLHYAFINIDGSQYTSLADPISITTMLCEAAAEQGANVVEMIQTADYRGETPLHNAATRGATMCCLLLRKKGAELNVKNGVDNYPLSLALKSKHHGCAMTFMQEGASANCNVCWPVTEEAKKNYEKSLEARKWVWNLAAKNNQTDPPEPVIESAFLVAIKNDWQGVAYLMLQMGGLPFIDAYKAALQANKIQLLWTILKKQRKSEPLFAVDEEGAGLLHLLAMYSTKCTTAVKNCRDVAELLISRGLSAKTTDAHGSTPLHYAAQHGDLSLCQVFVENAPETLNVLNKREMNPVTLAFESGVQVCSFNVAVIKFLMKKGTEKLDLLYNTGCKLKNGETEYATILNDLVLCGNIGNFEDTSDKRKVPRMGCIEYFLKMGANINFPDGLGHTPIMTSVLNNDIECAELLLKYRPNLALQDVTGWSVIHHCVQSSEYTSHENVDMLELLAKKNAPLNLKDNEGRIPAFYAMQQGSGVMLQKLKALYLKYVKAPLKVEEEVMDTGERGYEFTTTREQFWTYGKIDVKADAQHELDGLKTVAEVADPEPFDGKIQMGDSCVVYIDPVRKVPYDAVLTKVDVRWGSYGLNSFYKLQVVHHVGKDLWVLFNRWGRIGDNGQHQQTPFSNPEEAVKEFLKIFKSKTGNEWSNLPNFQKKPKKYTILEPEKNPERMLHLREEVIKDYDPKACAKSNLPDSLKEFLHDFVDPKVMKTSVSRERQVNSSYLPFGLISRDVLEKSLKLLDEIDALVESLSGKDVRVDPDAPGIYEKIATLSNDYYMMVPPSNYRFERIRPLNRSNHVDTQRRLVKSLLELSHTSQLLLAAQHRHKEINPLDYCYWALDTHVELLDPKGSESQLILEYIDHQTTGSRNYEIQGIYRVQRVAKSDPANLSTVGNKQLLWHGTKTAHMVGILKDGLQVDAPYSYKCGNRFGEGLYFSVDFEKSLGYCDYYPPAGRYMLLCEVALGKIYYNGEDDRNGSSEWSKDHDSFWLRAKRIPDPQKDQTTPYGAKVACGIVTDNNSVPDNERYLLFYGNEVVVADPKQARIRYVVRVKS